MTRKKASATRLPRWHERSIYWSLGLLAVSGAAWLLFDYFVRVEGEFGPEHHPIQAWSLMVHGIVAYAFLVVAGALIPVHVRVGLAQHKNLKSGVALGLLCIGGSLTALALYYLGNETGRQFASLTHWIAGLVIVPTLIVHALRGRRG